MLVLLLLQLISSNHAYSGAFDHDGYSTVCSEGKPGFGVPSNDDPTDGTSRTLGEHPNCVERLDVVSTQDPKTWEGTWWTLCSRVGYFRDGDRMRIEK